MATRKPSQAKERLNDLHARIDAWRQTRERYARMPPELWGEATALAEELGAAAVQQALVLNRTSLLRRTEESECGRRRRGDARLLKIATQSGRLRFAGRVHPGSTCMDVTYYSYDANGNLSDIKYPAADPNSSSTPREIQYVRGASGDDPDAIRPQGCSTAGSQNAAPIESRPNALALLKSM
jgi:hypothetical protein